MIVVADIGGSKSDWRLIQQNKVEQFKTQGIHVNEHDSLKSVELIPHQLKDLSLQPDAIYLYVAGLLDPVKTAQLKANFAERYNQAKIEVATDVLGAARSLFGTESGIACILGTGSAVCYYDGSSLIKRIPGLGPLLGDEGSGFAFGKVLLQLYLRGHLPEHLLVKFNQEYGKPTESEIVQQSYADGGKRYVASFAPFIVQHQSDPFIYGCIVEQLNCFFDGFFDNEETIKNQNIRFTGSMAYFLSNVLQKVARDRQLRVDLISQYPISGLTLYHQQHG